MALPVLVLEATHHQEQRYHSRGEADGQGRRGRLRHDVQLLRPAVERQPVLSIIFNNENNENKNNKK
jgi:hypothetical protein